MAVLVTGASGLIGRQLVPTLAARDRVWAISRRGDRQGDGRLTWMAGDLALPALPDGMPRDIETVVHLAQSEHHADFPERALDVFSVNAGSTARLLEWSRLTGVKRFVLASVGDVDGNRSYYHASKRAAELFARHYTRFFHVVILRFFFVYGAGQRRSMLIPRLVDAVERGTPVTLDGPDGMRLNPIHVSDAAAAVARAARLEQSERLDVAGPDVLTMRALVEIIGATLDTSPLFSVNADTRPQDYVGDIGPMSRLLGKPERSFASAVDEVRQR